ncbi:MAG: diguanylate cyclase [Acidobacteriota bacterium]
MPFPPILRRLLAALALLLCSGAATASTAREGRLDLSLWDFDSSGPAALVGEWQIFRDALGVPPEGSAELVELPGSWATPPGVPFATGFATYRLTVDLGPEAPPILALRITGVRTAYELRVNGMLYGGVGTVGSSAETSIPKSRERIFYIPRNSRLDLELRVSNYHFRTGGPRRELELGLPEQLRPTLGFRLARALFFFGCLGTLALFHLLVFFLRRDLRAALYFGMLSLLTSGHLLVVDHDIFQLLVPSLGWQLGLRLEYTFFILIMGSFWLYLGALFPTEFKRSSTHTLAAAAAMLALCLYLVPTVWASSVLLRVAQVLLLASVPYASARIGIAALSGRTNALPFLIGAGVFMLCGVVDTLTSFAPDFLDRAPPLTPLGFLFFLLSQTIAMARSVATAFGNVEHLSQRLLSLDRLKDEFLANTSHELRTPLHGMVGVADSLRRGAEGPLGSPVRRQLGMIVDSGNRLARLVDDILDLSSMRASELKIEPTLCSVPASVEVVCTLLRPIAEEKGIQLRNQVPPNFAGVHADEARLHQILHNLIGNAIKFTDHGDVTVTAKEGRRNARIEVTDTGIGMTREEQRYVFEPFEQARGSENRPHSGTGLGLAIARQLAELHGGRITCSSVIGAGSTFTLQLPLSHDGLLPQPVSPDSIRGENVGDGEAVLAPPEVEPQAGKNQGATVLVVDDDPVNRTVLVNYLATDGYKVLVASSGSEALELMAKQPDVVVLDVMMPRISGIDVCKKLRKRYPANELPILFLTAKTRPGDVVSGLAAGANDYISKPVNREEFLARVETHIVVKRLTDERLELEQAVHKDPLTGLANRRRLDAAMAKGYGEDGDDLAVLYIDLDDFKRINDDYGHDIGDRILRATADRLRQSLRDHDLIARVGGDEFVVVLSGSAMVAAAKAERLEALLREPVEALGSSVAVGASIGVATRKGEETIAELLRAADEDMYRAKRARAGKDQGAA